jgi:hypothetical protein
MAFSRVPHQAQRSLQCDRLDCGSKVSERVATGTKGSGYFCQTGCILPTFIVEGSTQQQQEVLIVDEP